MPGITNSIGNITGATGSPDGIAVTSLGNIANTVIQSKGDLIISPGSTALNGYSRNVPVGLNDSILSSNPIKASGVGWEKSGTNSWDSRAIGYYVASTGALFPKNFNAGFATTSTLTANRLVCLPFSLDRMWNAQRIGMTVQTAVAASVVRLGIYDTSGTGGFPGSLILDAGTIDTSGTGEKTILINKYLYGNYWLVYVSTSTPTMNGSNTSGTEWQQTIGKPDTSTTGNSPFLYEDGVGSYQTSLPSSLSSDTFSVASSTLIAHIWLRTFGQ